MEEEARRRRGIIKIIVGLSVIAVIVAITFIIAPLYYG